MKLVLGPWSVVLRKRTPVRAAGALTDAEVLNALALTDEHPTWKALEQLLGEALEESVVIVSDYRTSEKPGLLTHTAGGIEALRAFRERLRNLRAEALHPTSKNQ